MTRNSLSRKPAGFTRVELLVVLVFVVLGGGVLMASVARARGAADRAQSMSNLHVLVIAVHDFGDEHGGTLPTGRANLFPRLVKFGTAKTVHYGSCLFRILPHIKEDRLYKASLVNIEKTQLYASWELAGKPVKQFVAPGDPTADPASDRTSYLVNGLAFPGFFGLRMPGSFTDGLSNTIFLAEGYSQAVDLFPGGADPTKPPLVDRRWWDDPTWTPMPPFGVTEPRPFKKVGDPMLPAPPFQVAPPTPGASVLLPQGFDPGGIIVALGDGSTRSVSPKCSATTFYAACTPAEFDILGDDW
jgi:hypothetical protein